MSGATIAAPVARHHLVADIDLWRRNRVWLLYPAGLLVAFTIVGVVASHVFDPSLAVLAVILAAAAGLVYLRKATRYVAVVPEGLLLRAGRRRFVVPFAQLRLARTQTLASVYEAPSRRGQLPALLRRYAGSQVVVVRIDEGSPALAAATRVLGTRSVVERDLVLLVEEASRLAAALVPAIPRRPPTPSARGARSGRRRAS